VSSSLPPGKTGKKGGSEGNNATQIAEWAAEAVIEKEGRGRGVNQKQKKGGNPTHQPRASVHGNTHKKKEGSKMKAQRYRRPSGSKNRGKTSGNSEQKSPPNKKGAQYLNGKIRRKRKSTFEKEGKGTGNTQPPGLRKVRKKKKEIPKNKGDPNYTQHTAFSLSQNLRGKRAGLRSSL